MYVDSCSQMHGLLSYKTAQLPVVDKEVRPQNFNWENQGFFWSSTDAALLLQTSQIILGQNYFFLKESEDTGKLAENDGSQEMSGRKKAKVPVQTLTRDQELLSGAQVPSVQESYGYPLFITPFCHPSAVPDLQLWTFSDIPRMGRIVSLTAKIVPA